jgi:hypothetical protein
MLAKVETENERMVPISKLAPTRTPECLCSGCLRPKPAGHVDYICMECGAWHYKDQIYICCPADAERPL